MVEESKDGVDDSSLAAFYLHSMVVLPSYQADLLKDMDQEQGLYPEVFAELCPTTNFALHATKQTDTDIGC